MSNPPPQRRRLARELLSLRKASGLNQTQLADRIGVSQSYVSKVEGGERIPPVPTVEAWARVTGAPVEKRVELADLATTVQVENVEWRDALRDGQPARQFEVAADEAAATALRNFQPILVPGLLQVRSYARRVAELVDPFQNQDWERSADNRMIRQQQALSSGKELEFVMAEGALWWRPASLEIQLAQLNRLVTALTLPNVSIGIVPRTAAMPTLVMNPFVIYEGPEDAGLPFVRAESVHGTASVRAPDAIELYRHRFDLMKGVAVFANTARELLDRTIEELRSRPSAG